MAITQRRKHGAKLEYIDIDENGELKLEQLDEYLATGNVKLVAISHVSNVLGTITDVQRSNNRNAKMLALKF